MQTLIMLALALCIAFAVVAAIFIVGVFVLTVLVIIAGTIRGFRHVIGK